MGPKIFLCIHISCGLDSRKFDGQIGILFLKRYIGTVCFQAYERILSLRQEVRLAWDPESGLSVFLVGRLLYLFGSEYWSLFSSLQMRGCVTVCAVHNLRSVSSTLTPSLRFEVRPRTGIKLELHWNYWCGLHTVPVLKNNFYGC